ncbi:MAG: CapA family protein [Phormidesmis sp.]
MASASPYLDPYLSEQTRVPMPEVMMPDALIPDLPMQASFAGLDVRQMAAEGYFQAIAYWLNEPLVAQNLYAQVLADEVPGRIKVLVEFERAPVPRRLVRFVCDRIYQLNSHIIEGVHLVARAVGAAKTDWEQAVRIPTAQQRAAKLATDKSAEKALLPIAVPEASSQSPQLVHESSRSQVARQVVRSQFKFFRAALISGSAIAAFLFGGFTELILSERLSTPVASQLAAAEASVDWWRVDPEQADFLEAGSADSSDPATQVAFRPASRFKGRTVEAALETVAVIPHRAVTQPANPTVTLLFGGDLSLNDFPFETADDLDQLFSDIDIYEQADVAMLGLSEPLAYASTSLQEDFYRRTRPQAVQALKAGGVDIVSLASEGTMTYGAVGLTETLKNLDRQGIYRVGAGRNQQEAHRPEILEVKGQRIAYLGYNPEALREASAEQAGVASASSEERQHIVEDIRAIRAQVDWIVVNYRWGDLLKSDTAEAEATEETAKSAVGASTPPLKSGVAEDWQKVLAHEAVDAGADLVVGYHPSQIQGAEIYRDRAIAYSLGDFVFDNAPLNAPLQDQDTAALRVSLRNQQMKVEFLPVTIRDSKLQMATDEKGEAILHAIREASEPFKEPLRFPAVLNAQPRRTIKPEPDQPSAPSLPEAAEDVSNLEDTTFESTVIEPIEASPAWVAPDPIMQESDALFLPDAKPAEEPAAGPSYRFPDSKFTLPNSSTESQMESPIESRTESKTEDKPAESLQLTLAK